MLGNDTVQAQAAVAATQSMSVSLELQQWNQVLGILADSPYRIVAPLIQGIIEQLQRQANSPLANGHDA